MNASPSLGEYLRQEREKRGITVEQVSSATRISLKVLLQLEGDQYQELPAKPFIRGFVTSYCRFIGLEPRDVLARFNPFIDQKSKDRPSREGGHSGYAFHQRDGGDQSRMLLWLVMGSFVVLGAITLIFIKPSSLRHRKRSAPLVAASSAPTATTRPEPTPTVTVAAVPPPREAEVAPSPTPPPKPSPKPPAELPAVASTDPSLSNGKPDLLQTGADLLPSTIKYKIIVKALADVQVRYRSDHRQPTKFIFRKGRVLVVRAHERVVFQVSNPKSVSLNYNGRMYNPFSLEKSIRELQGTATVVFPRDAAQAVGDDPFPGEKPLPKTDDPSDTGSNDAPQSELPPESG